jgi:hypothetical protein
MPARRKPPHMSLTEARVLAALSRVRPRQASMSRSTLARACGYSSRSGTVNRALYGVPPGSSSGKPRPGLLNLGYVTALRPKGMPHDDFEICPAGQAALDAYLADHGPLPTATDQSSKTNKRYLAD